MLRYCATGLPFAVKITQTMPETEERKRPDIFFFAQTENRRCDDKADGKQEEFQKDSCPEKFSEPGTGGRILIHKNVLFC